MKKHLCPLFPNSRTPSLPAIYNYEAAMLLPIKHTTITVDTQGTNIQATLLNKYIKTWKNSLKPNKSYYIAKGRLDRVNPNYSSVHKEVELAFTDNTIIKETDHEVSTHKFSDEFLSLDDADKLPNDAILGNYPDD
ncbi:hypothetical protein KY290_017673 [Solanum tuberosum]|uniref:Uncharacterized protein n=1 Tax=Solanum tuberosum TaxID=4113 RepID=A0ABQ7VBY7_SOLTU|nr:hypothetical protein KY285_016661 [Solanum tuberosum]KAH0761600.1 hypothetical protein KY290_017673 [Solanum tuberosum]